MRKLVVLEGLLGFESLFLRDLLVENVHTLKLGLILALILSQ
jgi:hypothetical protein